MACLTVAPWCCCSYENGVICRHRSVQVMATAYVRADGTDMRHMFEAYCKADQRHEDGNDILIWEEPYG